jgi:transcriptional regulator with XRE-family HTH domain
MSSWRRRLGGLFLVERVQVRGWNLAEAAREAKINEGTIRRIEHGKNYEIEKLERYAEKLGRPLEVWLREVLAIPDDLIERLSEWSKDGPAPGEMKPTEKRRHEGK